jgi:hypothetical protein
MQSSAGCNADVLRSSLQVGWEGSGGIGSKGSRHLLHLHLSWR